MLVRPSKLTSAAEVERAAKLLREEAKGRTVTRVQTFEDSLVFSGITHGEFVSAAVLSNSRRHYY